MTFFVVFPVLPPEGLHFQIQSILCRWSVAVSCF